MANALFNLNAYRKNNTWMFDDESRDIREEPFVAGADIVFDFMSGFAMDQSKDTCNIVFGATPIPEYDLHVKLNRGDGYDGHFYNVEYFKQYPESNGIKLDGLHGFEFWLCPALLAFFDKAPQNIYVKRK